MTAIADVPSDFAEVRGAVEEGRTLPSSWYVEPAIFDLEQERIFGRSWQYAGHLGQLLHPGDYFARMIGRIPVVVLRDLDGALRAFVNICCHRAHEVALGSGNRKTLQCLYHGWTYNLDGKLRAAPRADHEPDFDPSRFALEPIQVDTWGPLVWVNPSQDDPPLADVLGDLPSLLSSRGLELDGKQYQCTQTLSIPSNWKVFVDNGDECYHCPTCHPGLSEEYDLSFDNYGLTTGPMWIAHNAALKLPADGHDPTPYDLQSYHIYPNVNILSGYGDGEPSYTVEEMLPLTAESTALVQHFFAARDWDEATIEGKCVIDQTLKEDFEICARVQRAHRSGRAPQGSLLLNSEHQIHHFQKYIVRALSV
jgi:choline monooxygenase